MRCIKLRVICFLVMSAAVFNGRANTWINLSGGVFSEGANWHEGVPPGPTDSANFNDSAQGTYTVTFTADATFFPIYMRFSGFHDVTFDMGGFNIVVPEPTYVNWQSIAIDMRTSEDVGPHSLTLTNGTMTSGAIKLGAWNGTVVTNQSTLVVGAGATLVTTGDVSIAHTSQRAALVVEDGGTWEHTKGPTYIGTQIQSYGLIRVDGPGSVVDFDSTGTLSLDLYIGYSASTGVVQVVNGGIFRGSRHLQLGMSTVDAHGIISADGANSEIRTKGYISVGADGTGVAEAKNGGLISAGSYVRINHPGSTAIARDGGMITAAGSGVYVYSGGTLEIDNGTVEAATLATFYSGSTYKLTLHTPDTATLTCSTDFTMSTSDPGVTLNLSLRSNFYANLGDEFKVCTYGGNRIGTFNGLAQDAEIEVGSYTFQIDYGSGSNDSVILRVIAVPPKGTVFSS